MRYLILSSGLLVALAAATTKIMMTIYVNRRASEELGNQ
jgi:hypothetical protein